MRRVWTKAFLIALEQTGGSVSKACEAAKVSSTTAYGRKKNDVQFRERWEAALDRAADLLEDEARRRAFKGSDNLLMFLLKGARPERFRESRASIPPAELNKLIESELARISASKKKEDEEEAEALVN